jgi:histidine triad (HIT) family protein
MMFLDILLVMEESIFTKIIKGEIPCHKVYEDERTIAFLDIHPIQPGHVLVIPKKQVEFLWDLDDETYTALMSSVKKVGTQLRQIMDKPYVGIRVFGIDVPHVHIHLVPFTDAAEFNNKPDMSKEPDHVQLAEIAAKIAF